MSEHTPEQLVPQYPFTTEEIAQANAGDHEAIVNDYVDQKGGYDVSEEDSEEGCQASIVLSDQAEGHAQKVQQGVKDMYEDAYAENAQHDAGSEK